MRPLLAGLAVLGGALLPVLTFPNGTIWEESSILGALIVIGSWGLGLGLAAYITR